MNEGRIDAELISRFRSGERRALEEIYLTFYDPIFLFASSLVRDYHEANDITADTFIKLWRQHDRFGTLSGIRGFLYTTCRNACIDVLRARQRHDLSHQEIRYLAREEETDTAWELEELALLKEVRIQVEKLPPRCRQIFELIFFKMMRNTEVAELLGISLATVQGQRTIAIRKLRDALSRNRDIGGRQERRAT